MGILMRHSEEGETPERRAGGQTKGLLLKVCSLYTPGAGLSGGEEMVYLGQPVFILLTHFSAARVCVRLVRRPRPQVLATECPVAKVSKAG